MIALVTLVFIFLDTVVAVVFKDLGTVLGITGAIGSSTIMMILPSLMYMTYLKKNNNHNWGKWLFCVLHTQIFYPKQPKFKRRKGI